MDLTASSFLQIDLPALLAAVFATVTCALLGNFLVLRRQSLMGDAISHSVLPGIVLGFLMAGSRATWPMFAGATAAAVAAAVLIELVRRIGRVESGAAMGVVFSVFFAGGVVLIEQAAAHAIDLDAECVLYGQLEDILWLAPTGWASLLDPAVWAEMPREVVTLAGVALICALAVTLFYKELKITSFDPELATTLGIPAGVFNIGLMLLVGMVAVAAFEAVGSILVIAMFICPAAAARLLTDRLAVQIGLSLLIAAGAAVSGYVLAAFGPFWLGGDSSLAASGMIAVMTGVALAAAILFGPRYGVLARRRHGAPPALPATSAVRWGRPRGNVMAASTKIRLPGVDLQAEGFGRTRSDHRNEIAEDYVELIADLIDVTGEARAVDLANRLGVTSATVNNTITRLQREGLVHSEPYRSIFLTTDGRALAEHCRRRHRIVYRFLRTLGVSEEVARADTEGIEHHVSDETLEALDRLLRERGERS